MRVCREAPRLEIRSWLYVSGDASVWLKTRMCCGGLPAKKVCRRKASPTRAFLPVYLALPAACLPSRLLRTSGLRCCRASSTMLARLIIMLPLTAAIFTARFAWPA